MSSSRFNGATLRREWNDATRAELIKATKKASMEPLSGESGMDFEIKIYKQATSALQWSHSPERVEWQLALLSRADIFRASMEPLSGESGMLKP